MSIASIIAFLAFLSAFNVPTPTIQHVSDILYASQASTTSLVATTTLQVTPTGEATVSTSTPAQNDTSPVFGGIITPMDKSGIEVRNISKNPVSGYYFMDVSVLDANGKAIQNAPFHFNIPAESVETGPTAQKTDQITKNESYKGAGDWHNTVYYIPNGFTGTKDLTFTSDNLTKTVSIEVQ